MLGGGAQLVEANKWYNVDSSNPIGAIGWYADAKFTEPEWKHHDAPNTFFFFPPRIRVWAICASATS